MNWAYLLIQSVGIWRNQSPRTTGHVLYLSDADLYG